MLCCTPTRLLAAYGSAVAGLAISGLLGRRTGAAISELPADVWAVRVVLEVSLDNADGGLAAPARAAPDRAATPEEPGVDFTGEKCACAELGRSGMFFAANAALRCAAIASRTDGRAVAAGRAFEVVVVVLEIDEASELEFGLCGSFSSCCRDFGSRLSMIFSA